MVAIHVSVYQVGTKSSVLLTAGDYTLALLAPGPSVYVGIFPPAGALAAARLVRRAIYTSGAGRARFYALEWPTPHVASPSPVVEDAHSAPPCKRRPISAAGGESIVLSIMRNILRLLGRTRVLL